jgi:hypothetical protein
LLYRVHSIDCFAAYLPFREWFEERSKPAPKYLVVVDN